MKNAGLNALSGGGIKNKKGRKIRVFRGEIVIFAMKNQFSPLGYRCRQKVNLAAFQSLLEGK